MDKGKNVCCVLVCLCVCVRMRARARATSRKDWLLEAIKMRWMATALAVAVATFLVVGAGGSGLDDLIKLTEDHVRRLQKEASRLFKERHDIIPSCTCSEHSCVNGFVASCAPKFWAHQTCAKAVGRPGGW